MVGLNGRTKMEKHWTSFIENKKDIRRFENGRQENKDF